MSQSPHPVAVSHNVYSPDEIYSVHVLSMSQEKPLLPGKRKWCRKKAKAFTRIKWHAAHPSSNFPRITFSPLQRALLLVAPPFHSCGSKVTVFSHFFVPPIIDRFNRWLINRLWLAMSATKVRPSITNRRLLLPPQRNVRKNRHAQLRLKMMHTKRLKQTEKKQDYGGLDPQKKPVDKLKYWNH